MKRLYTDEENTLILISLLKEHGIRYIIASPGTTNISFVGSVQYDSYFKVFSAVDERAAAYMACGLAEESGEPVVLTCTGATASRNYLPGLTEAYYRHLPVLAVTYSQHFGRVGNHVAQVIDRSEQFHDLVKKSCQIPMVKSKEDTNSIITTINDALLELTHNDKGPVHVNIQTAYSNRFVVEKLPSCRVIRRITTNEFPEIPDGKNAIWVGAHKPFSTEEIEAIDTFCEKHNAIVICDHISNYKGKYRFLASLTNSQEPDLGTRAFDLVVYIGQIHGAYLRFNCKQLWRVSPDGIIRDPFYNCTFVFELEEKAFFEHYSSGKNNNTILKTSIEVAKQIQNKVPDLPLSNLWVAKETAMAFPTGAIVHFGILNSLRAWNYFEMPDSISCYANIGGYGIDGGISSFLGSAYSTPSVEHYLIVGDLAFFYDLNALMNRIPNNIHIMLINNGVGTEFKNYNHRAAYFGDEADPFIAAKGHNGNKKYELVKNICQDLGIHYLAASSKEEYCACKDNWVKEKVGPILIEVFTSDKDESDALRMMNTIIQDQSLRQRIGKSRMGRILRGIVHRVIRRK